MVSRVKRWGAVVSGCLLSGLFLMVFYGPFLLAWIGDQAGPPFSNPFDDRAFDRRIWAHSSGSDRESPRGQMTSDLIANHLKPGMRKAEVEQLLGKPDTFEDPNSFEPVSPHSQNAVLWCYGIGSWSGFRMDGDILAVHFDNSGQLVNAWHYQT